MLINFYSFLLKLQEEQEGCSLEETATSCLNRYDSNISHESIEESDNGCSILDEDTSEGFLQRTNVNVQKSPWRQTTTAARNCKFPHQQKNVKHSDKRRRKKAKQNLDETNHDSPWIDCNHSKRVVSKQHLQRQTNASLFVSQTKGKVKHTIEDDIGSDQERRLCHKLDVKQKSGQSHSLLHDVRRAAKPVSTYSGSDEDHTDESDDDIPSAKCSKQQPLTRRRRDRKLSEASIVELSKKDVCIIDP